MQYPLSNLLPNGPHNPTAWMRTTATNPNPPNLATGPIGKQILNPNTPMENIALSQRNQVFEIMRSQDVHEVDIEGLFEIFGDFGKENLFYLGVGDRTGGGEGFWHVWVIWGILQETVHDIVSLWAHSFIEDTGDRYIHKRIQTHPLSLGLLECSFQLLHCLAVYVDGSLEESLGGKGMVSEGFEFGEFFKGDVYFCGCSIVLDVLEFVVYLFREYFFRLFDQIEESYLICTVTQYSIRLYYIPIHEFNTLRLIPIIQYLLNPIIKLYSSSPRSGRLGQNLRKPPIPTLNIPPLSLPSFLELAHHMMQQNVSC